MLIHLQDLSILTGLAPGAVVDEISTRWPDGERVRVYLRCTIGQGEGTESLRDLGIEGQTIEVQFRQVLRAETAVTDSRATGEAVTSWELVRYPEMSSKVIHSGAEAYGHLFQHKIRYSSGSTLDVVCGQVWLSDAKGD